MTSLTYAVVDAAERLVAKYGLEDAGSRIGLAPDIGPPPSPGDHPTLRKQRGSCVRSRGPGLDCE